MESEQEVQELKKNLEENVNFAPVKSPIKRLNYFWKDKEGKELSYREFMDRWKKGMEGITPLQQIKGQLNSTYIMLLGIAAGFVVTLFNLKNLWWLTIILGAAFFNSGIAALGLWQKVRILENLEREVDNNE